jgi:hypothetical protein
MKIFTPPPPLIFPSSTPFSLSLLRLQSTAYNIHNYRFARTVYVELADEFRRGEITTAQFLERGSVQYKKNNTALTMAAQHGHEDVIRTLLQHGVKVDHANSLGETSVMLAAWHGHEEVVKILIEHKAELNPARHNTALLLASKAGHAAIVTLLLYSHMLTRAYTHTRIHTHAHTHTPTHTGFMVRIQTASTKEQRPSCRPSNTITWR